MGVYIGSYISIGYKLQACINVQAMYTASNTACQYVGASYGLSLKPIKLFNNPSKLYECKDM